MACATPGRGDGRGRLQAEPAPVGVLSYAFVQFRTLAAISPVNWAVDAMNVFTPVPAVDLGSGDADHRLGVRNAHPAQSERVVSGPGVDDGPPGERHRARHAGELGDVERVVAGARVRRERPPERGPV